MTMGKGKTTTGLSGYNVYLRFIEEGVACAAPSFLVRRARDAGRWAGAQVFSPPAPGLRRACGGIKMAPTADCRRQKGRLVRVLPYLLGAIQNLRSGKLTMTASKVLTTEAMVEASAASMPKEPWQKDTT